MDRKNLIVVATGSAFESAEILEYLFETTEIKEEEFHNFVREPEQISKMLFSLIQHLEKTNGLREERCNFHGEGCNISEENELFVRSLEIIGEATKKIPVDFK